MKAIVARAGFLTTIQDSGRPGYREAGVSLGGALDGHALQVANLIVGNHGSAAGLEITLDGFQIQFTDQRLVAWCGGAFDVGMGSISIPAGHRAVIGPGENLKFNHPRNGCRCWLAISGGIDVPIVLGSSSTDVRANFGGLDGRALRAGDELRLGNDTRPILTPHETISSWSGSHDWVNTARTDPVLRFVRGSGWDLFDKPAHRTFTSTAFGVSSGSDRMGVRLEGPNLKRHDNFDLISEAVAPGTIQIPPAGNPILLLGDCQTIGGYPKIAHVASVDLGIAAQLRTGDQVRFSEISLSEAHRLLLERDRETERFRVGLALRKS